MAACRPQKPRGFSTSCLPISKDRYHQLVTSPTRFRPWLDQAFRETPERFPAACAAGYTLTDARVSTQRGLRLRRSRCTATGAAFAVRPCFVLPYLTAWTDAAAEPRFLRSCGVPFGALAQVFGNDPPFW